MTATVTRTPRKKRRPLISETERVKLGVSRAVRGFHAPQRDRAPKVPHPKPLPLMREVRTGRKQDRRAARQALKAQARFAQRVRVLRQREAREVNR